MPEGQPRIYHDFNYLYGEKGAPIASAPLTCSGTRKDLERLQLTLKDGMTVILYQPDDVDTAGNPDCLDVTATVRYDPQSKCFMADFAYSELRYRSEAHKDAQKKL